jgi:hypothetical protein
MNFMSDAAQKMYLVRRNQALIMNVSYVLMFNRN